MHQPLLHFNVTNIILTGNSDDTNPIKAELSNDPKGVIIPMTSIPELLRNLPINKLLNLIQHLMARFEITTAIFVRENNQAKMSLKYCSKFSIWILSWLLQL